jgi:hypothetical protein
VGTAGVVVVEFSSTLGPPHQPSTETVFSAILLSTTARLGSVHRGTTKESGHLSALVELETVLEVGRVGKDDFLGRSNIDTVLVARRVKAEALSGSEFNGTGGEVGNESGRSVGSVARFG